MGQKLPSLYSIYETKPSFRCPIFEPLSPALHDVIRPSLVPRHIPALRTHAIIRYRHTDHTGSGLKSRPLIGQQNELDANKYLRVTNIQAFDDNEKLWKDMSLFSLVAYLWTEQHDWQISRENLSNSNMPFQTFQFLSKSDDKRQCTKIDLSAIQAMLRGAHNVFAEFKPVGLPFDYMCLPPNSSIFIVAEHIVISSPYCTIDFTVQQIPALQLNRKPGTIDITRLFGAGDGIRTHDPNLGKVVLLGDRPRAALPRRPLGAEHNSNLLLPFRYPSRQHGPVLIGTGQRV